MGLLDAILFRWNVLLDQRLDLVRIVLVLFFLLLDYVLLEASATAATTLVLSCSFWLIKRCLLWLSIWSKTYLKMLLLLLLAFQADRDCFLPTVLGECLFVLGRRFLNVSDLLLQLRVLRVSPLCEAGDYEDREQDQETLECVFSGVIRH